MRLPGLNVKRPPSSSEARKLRCFFKSRAVMLLVSSREGSGRFAATTDTASKAASRVAVRARFNDSFGLIEIPFTTKMDASGRRALHLFLHQRLKRFQPEARRRPSSGGQDQCKRAPPAPRLRP